MGEGFWISTTQQIIASAVTSLIIFVAATVLKKYKEEWTGPVWFGLKVMVVAIVILIPTFILFKYYSSPIDNYSTPLEHFEIRSTTNNNFRISVGPLILMPSTYPNVPGWLLVRDGKYLYASHVTGYFSITNLQDHPSVLDLLKIQFWDRCRNQWIDLTPLSADEEIFKASAEIERGKADLMQLEDLGHLIKGGSG